LNVTIALFEKLFRFEARAMLNGEALRLQPVNNISWENRRMAESPKLREISNGGGGSVMTRSDCQRANSSEGACVPGDAAFSTDGLPLMASKVAGRDADVCGSLDPADSRAARWASLSPSDREVFKLWARGVLAFYAVIVTALLTAALLGVHANSGGKSATASHLVERDAPESFASRPGSAGK